MITEQVGLEGAFTIEPERVVDERGYFARIFCAEEFARLGLRPDVSQSSVSYNAVAGTLRGMHWQALPHGECKLVRCVRGAVWDVIVDVRPGSDTYRQWWSVELSAANGTMLYVPEGVAHGFLTLARASEVMYQMSDPYVPEAARGVRWDDPAFGIAWPSAPAVMSDRDRTYPDFRP
jgi:dTDP-4-dehydrorhamnose 3,5-epimerase